jgi:hypothetical protein
MRRLADQPFPKMAIFVPQCGIGIPFSSEFIPLFPHFVSFPLLFRALLEKVSMGTT